MSAHFANMHKCGHFTYIYYTGIYMEMFSGHMCQKFSVTYFVYVQGSLNYILIFADVSWSCCWALTVGDWLSMRRNRALAKV